MVFKVYLMKTHFAGIWENTRATNIKTRVLVPNSSESQSYCNTRKEQFIAVPEWSKFLKSVEKYASGEFLNVPCFKFPLKFCEIHVKTDFVKKLKKYKWHVFKYAETKFTQKSVIKKKVHTFFFQDYFSMVF